MKRTLLTAFLAFTALAAASAFTPAEADDASIYFFREPEGPSYGRFPAMSEVDCVGPCCIHNRDGALNRQSIDRNAGENSEL